MVCCRWTAQSLRNTFSFVLTVQSTQCCLRYIFFLHPDLPEVTPRARSAENRCSSKAVYRICDFWKNVTGKPRNLMNWSIINIKSSVTVSFTYQNNGAGVLWGTRLYASASSNSLMCFLRSWRNGGVNGRGLCRFASYFNNIFSMTSVNPNSVECLLNTSAYLSSYFLNLSFSIFGISLSS